MGGQVQSVIKTSDLGYQYAHGVDTLTNINLEVRQGEIYGFLGPNGSGKTTTLSLLLGLLQIQRGKIELFGKELASNRIELLRSIGSLIESPSLYSHLTARENLEIYRRVYQMPRDRIAEVLGIAGLADTGSKRVKHFSLGMKQRLSIALALLPQPRLLILDEPTNGFDPNGIIELRELLRSLNRDHGVTIIISSHILAEVEKIVSHVGIIARGQMIFQGSREELLRKAGARLLIRTSDDDRAVAVLEKHSARKVAGSVALPLVDDDHTASINRRLVENNIDVFAMHSETTNLEQLFIELTSPS